MHKQQQADFMVLSRAQSFLDQHAQVLAALNSTPARTELDHLLDRIRNWTLIQEEALALSKRQTAELRERHRHLRETIARIVTIARGRPGKFGDFSTAVIPLRSASSASIRVSAGAILQQARLYRDGLVSEGLGEDIVDRLNSQIEDFGLAWATRSGTLDKQHAATSQMAADLRRAWIVVRMIRALFDEENPVQRRLLANWQTETIHAARLPESSKSKSLVAPPAPLALLTAGTPALAPSEEAESLSPAGLAPQPRPVRANRRAVLRAIAVLFGKEQQQHAPDRL